MRKRKLDERADQAAQKVGRRILPNELVLILESLLMVLALLCVFVLIVVFTVIAIRHRGRNVEPIAPIAEGKVGEGKSWKLWNKENN